MTISLRDVSQALEQAIAQRLGEPRFKLWFDAKTRFTWDDRRLTVGVPNRFYQEWLEKTFAGVVREAAQDVFGHGLEVAFVIDAELFQAARREDAQLPSSPAPQAPPSTAGPKAAAPTPTAGKARVRRWRQLKDFVVGTCNRVAHAAALAIVEAPGQEANPLVLHGPVGTGKTHLLEGIHAALRKQHPEWRVHCLTSEKFTNTFIQAVRLGKLTTFRKQFREVDVLLLDDLHFLGTKKATQEEFLHTFDTLLSEDKQVVVTCDGHPRSNEHYLPELADRLLGGGVWGISPPDPDTRRELLRGWAARPGQPPVSEEVVQFLADQLRGNVRELQGALHSVQHFSRVVNRPIDLALAREALGDVLRHSVRVLQLGDVDQAVCQVLRLQAGTLQSRQRAWHCTFPRMLALYLARKHTTATYAEVGQFFGGRNHSTAVAAEKKVRGWVQADEVLRLGEQRLQVREIIEQIERQLLS